jgi:hypothetical protein
MLAESDLRALVRDAIARYASGERRETVPPPSAAHPSHGRFVFLQSGDEEGACLIEPAVRCNHCGYCLSQGH